MVGIYIVKVTLVGFRETRPKLASDLIDQWEICNFNIIINFKNTFIHYLFFVPFKVLC
jgi:hypothetical protein